MEFFVVFLGAGIGGAIRYAISRALPPTELTQFPVGTLVINVVGSAILGALVAYFAARQNTSELLALSLTTGMMGGFTTFSSFSVEAVRMYQGGHLRMALLYVVLSVVLSIGAAFGMLLAVRHFMPPTPAAPIPITIVQPAPTDEALERAQRAARTFSEELRGTLMQALRDQGPEGAVNVCHEEAPAIAARVGEEFGLKLGRVALPSRERNAQQSASGWQLEALLDMDAAVRAGKTAHEQRFLQRDNLPDGVALRMMIGIETEGACVTCHGADIDPGLKATILAHYPDDHATGFDVGDLRGALWVEVPSR